jgi:hypothetical protein
MRVLLPLLLLPLVVTAPARAESLPQVVLHVDPAVAEGGTARVVVRLERPVSHDVSLRLDTRSREAVGRRDYTPVHQVVVIPAGRTHVGVDVEALADGRDEAAETFVVVATDPEGVELVDGADRARVTIADRDRPPRVLVENGTVAEPSITNQLGFTYVRLSAPSGRRVVVQLASRPGTATTADFVPLHPTAVFAPGETSQLVSVEVLPDDVVEGPETVRLVVTSVRHARPPARAAVITIDDADDAD